MDSNSADNNATSTPGIMATSPTQSARSFMHAHETFDDFNNRLSLLFFRSFALAYNYNRKAGRSASDLDAVANRAIDDAISQSRPFVNGSWIHLSWLTFWAARNLCLAVNYPSAGIDQHQPTVGAGPCVEALLVSHPGRQLDTLLGLVETMTGHPVDFNRQRLAVTPLVSPPQPLSSTSQQVPSSLPATAPVSHAQPAQQPNMSQKETYPALPPAAKPELPSKRPETHLSIGSFKPQQSAPASPPAPQGLVAEALDCVFRAEFKDHPSFQAKNGSSRPLPPFSVPLPKELNLKTDIFDGDKDIMHANLPYFELRVCKETHSIRLQLSPWTLDRDLYPTRTDPCGAIVDDMVSAYGWLSTWIIEMHNAKRVLPVYDHLKDYYNRPFHHKVYDMDQVKSRYNEWRVDWENYIQVIGPSDANGAIRRPAFMEAASFRELLVRIDRDPPDRSVMDDLAMALTIWVSDESPSVKDIREAVAYVGTAVLEHLAKLGVDMRTDGQPSDSEKIVGMWVTDTLNDLEGLAAGHVYVKPNAYIWSLINARE